MQSEYKRQSSSLLTLVLGFVLGGCMSYLALLYVLALNNGFSAQNARLRAQLRQERAALLRERRANEALRLQSVNSQAGPSNVSY